MKRPLLIFASFLGLAFSPARADYHYASHSGNNEYPYTSWQTAADSIQKAINAASPLDTVYVGNGEYDEEVLIDSDSLALIGSGWDSTLVWSDTRGIPTIGVVSNRNYSEYFEGLYILNRSGYWALGDCVGDNLHANRCRFSVNQAAIGVAAVPISTLVENCLFDSVGTGVSAILYCNEITVRNCMFTGNSARSVMIQPSGYRRLVIANNIIMGGGVEPVLGGGDSLLASNNLFFGCYGAYNLGSYYYQSFTNHTIDLTWHPAYAIEGGGPYRVVLNNSISNKNLVTPSPQDGGFIRLAYNDFWNVDMVFYQINPNAFYDTTGGNLWEYPMYFDPLHGDYHLQAYSPLIDAGDPSILDVDGTRSDIGCYGGPGGCSYVYLDLAPLIPDSLQGRVDSNMIVLTWRRNYEADFNRYQIFRDTVSGFQPSVFNMIAEPETAYYEDGSINPATPYYYRFTAVDNQGNISDHSDELAVIPVSVPGFLTDNLPKYTVITSAYPNPFNSNITIVYSASNLGPQPPEVSLKILDIGGRVVRTLFAGHKPAGTYRAIWDGRDDAGHPVASGTYIARVSQWGMSGGDFPIKITLVK